MRIQDQLVTVTYITLIGLTGVYNRDINGNKLTLSTNDWTYNNTFIIYNYETESRWFQLSGIHGRTCISIIYTDGKIS